MGRKSHGKAGSSKATKSKEGVVPPITGPRKLSPLKRNEVNQLVEKILKVSSSLPQGANTSKEWEVYAEVNKLLGKVEEAETDMRVPLPDRSGCIPDLIVWLQNNGAIMDGVSVQQFEGYDLGLRAEQDFEEGDLMLAVPRSLMLSVETARFSELGPMLSRDPMLQHMPNVALSLLLLLEKFRPDSFWAPYIAALPSQYNTVLYFSPTELAELKGSPALESALKQCRNIARQYAYFSKLFQKLNDPASVILRNVFSYEQYKWAASTVMTRQNYVPSTDGCGVVNALIPLWDLCNHAEGRLSTNFVPERDRSECVAWRRFPCGDQLFIFYGARPNCELLVHNGFVPTHNEHDAIALRLGVSRADPLYERRCALLARLALPAAGEFAIRAGADPIDPALRAFLRVFSMNAEQLEEWLDRDDSSDLELAECTLDTGIDTRASTFLAARVRLLLQIYPSTLEEDETLLASRGISPCRRLAVQQRVAEKMLLRSALEYTEHRLLVANH